MAIRQEAVRARRNRGSRARTVGIVGAASGVGRVLAERLAVAQGVKKVVAIDSERGDAGENTGGVTWRVLNPTDPAIVSRLSGCDIVVHTAISLDLTDDVEERSRTNVRGTQTVLTASAAAGVKRVVVVTSAMVYGASPDNPIPLDDDAPLQAESDGEVLTDLLDIEELCERAPRSHPGTAVTVVRPATVVGAGIDTALTRHFEAPRLLMVRGSSPRWQFCHVDDLAAALELVVLEDLDGPLTVGCDGYLEAAQVEEVSRRSHIELPSSFVFGTAQRLHRIGMTPAPSAELHYVTHPWVVSSARLRAAGWSPEHDNASALTDLMTEVSGRHALASRRIGRRETATAATIGAAGATVAILGTAVAVRKARRRKRSS